MRDLIRIVSAASLAACLSSAGVAMAQPQQRNPDLHAALHIRPDQEAAWRMFQQAATPQAGIIDTLRGSNQRAMSMNTPQRFDLESQNLALEATIERHQADAARALYMALSPDQQHTWDQLTRPPMNGQGQR